MKQSKKERDLGNLYRFCQEFKVVGWCSNVWFGALSTWYPCHLLIFTQDRSGFQWRREQAKKTIKNKLNHKIDKILSLPLREGDGELYDQLINKLDELIKDRQENDQ